MTVLEVLRLLVNIDITNLEDDIEVAGLKFNLYTFFKNGPMLSCYTDYCTININQKFITIEVDYQSEDIIIPVEEIDQDDSYLILDYGKILTTYIQY